MKALAAFRALGAREAGTAWRGGFGAVDRGLAAAVFLAAALGIWLEVATRSESFRALSARAGTGWLFRGALIVAALIGPLAFVRLLSRDRERGVLDLLLLSPVGATGLLLAKVAGRAVGFVAVLAAGIPGLVLLLPLGGFSLGELLSLLSIVLGLVLASGGIAAFFASGFRSPLAATVASWSLLALWLGAPAIARELGASPAAFRILSDLSYAGLVERELAGIFPDPEAALLAVGFGVAVLLAGCAAGGLLLRRRHVVGRSETLAERVGSAWRARVARLSAAPRWAKWFRPLFPSSSPLVRRESLVGRDAVFRFAWLAFAVAAGAAAMLLLPGIALDDLEDHALIAGIGFTGVLALVAVHGAAGFVSARTRGILEAYLAANVEPDEILRARAAGLAQRAIYLAIPWAVYLALAAAMLEPSPETLVLGFQVLAGAAIAVAGVATGPAVGLFTRRTALAAAGALFDVAASLLLGGVAGASPVGAIVLAPIFLGLLAGGHAVSVRQFRARVLR